MPFDSGLFMCDTSWQVSLSPCLSLSPLLPPLLASLSLHISKSFLSSLPDDDFASYFPERMEEIKRMHPLSLTLNKFLASVPFFFLLLVFPLCLCYTFCNYPTVLPFSFFSFPLCFKFGSFY